MRAGKYSHSHSLRALVLEWGTGRAAGISDRGALVIEASAEFTYGWRPVWPAIQGGSGGRYKLVGPAVRSALAPEVLATHAAAAAARRRFVQTWPY